MPKPGSPPSAMLSVAQVGARAGIGRARVHYIADRGAVGEVLIVNGARWFTEQQANMLVVVERLTGLGLTVEEAGELERARLDGRLDIGILQRRGRKALDEAQRAMAKVFVYARVLVDSATDLEEGDDGH